jgi:hypothetical protein
MEAPNAAAVAAANVGHTDPGLFNSFKKLNDIVYIRESSPYHEVTTAKTPLNSTVEKQVPTTTVNRVHNEADAPKTIVIFSWLGAHMRNIMKYVAGHLLLFPNARIILITTSFVDFRYSTLNRQKRRLRPAVEALLSTPLSQTYHPNQDQSDSLLIHSFSNGGAQTLTQFALAYRDLTNRAVPSRALILDSAPGKANYEATTRLLIQMLPKFFLFQYLGKGLIYFCIAVWRISSRLMQMRNQVDILRERLNDPKLFAVRARTLSAMSEKQTPGQLEIKTSSNRGYIYSESDDLIAFKDVEEHAQEASEHGFSTRLIKFEGSAHVAHPISDYTRYWQEVDKIWYDA